MDNKFRYLFIIVALLGAIAAPVLSNQQVYADDNLVTSKDSGPALFMGGVSKNRITKSINHL